MSMFGNRAKMNTGLINEAYAPYDQMVQEQAELARGMMDPQSAYSRQRMQQLRNVHADTTAVQNQGLIGLGASMNMNPAQLAMQAQMNRHTGRGTVGQQFDQGWQNQFQQGLNLQNQAATGFENIGSRISNMHMQQVNAQNAAVDRRQNLALQVAGMGLNMAAPFIPPPKA